VILSAGVVQSPQLLELSGVGSPSILHPLDIKVVVPNESVGQNLQDHAVIGMCQELAEGQMSMDNLRDPAVLEVAMKAYTEHGTGPFSTSITTQGFLPVWEKDSAAIEEALDSYRAEKIPTLQNRGLQSQYDLQISQLKNPKDISAQYLYIDAHVDTTRATQHEQYTPLPEGSFSFTAAVLDHPFSRGSSHIQSANPLDAPAYDPKYMSHPLDLEITISHVKQLKALLDTEPLASLFKKGGRSLPDNSNLTDRESLIAYIQKTCVTEYHPVGTCAMLPRDAGGVVDSRLRVYGVNNLRVVDASIFPLIVRGHTISLIYAVAEKASDMIKEDQRI